MCVNGKGIAMVTLKSMGGAMIRCYIDLSLQNHISRAAIISLSIAGRYQRVFL